MGSGAGAPALNPQDVVDGLGELLDRTRREAGGAMLPGKKRIGRPHATGLAELATLRRLVAEGTSVTEAARTLKIGRSTACEALANSR